MLEPIPGGPRRPARASREPFPWTRRILGGRSLTWGRLSYRLAISSSPPATAATGTAGRFHTKKSCPITSESNATSGMRPREGLPELPDGIMQPPMAMNCGEWRFKSRVRGPAWAPGTLALQRQVSGQRWRKRSTRRSSVRIRNDPWTQRCGRPICIPRSGTG